jgi:pantetheine-phosphate adenylyltransferase
MTRAIVPGSFDPVTNGHVDIIEGTAGMFEDVLVVVARNSSKTPMFTVEERVSMLREVCAPFTNVRVDAFDGLLVHYAEAQNATVIVKGLRFVSDFEYELQMALVNRRQNSKIKTIFMPTGTEYSDLSSSIVKEIARHGGILEGLVPNIVQQRLRQKITLPHS